MALIDYRLCDVCNNKAFYDATLNYQHNEASGDVTLDRLGDWAVICKDCAKTHKCVIVRREDEPPEGA